MSGAADYERAEAAADGPVGAPVRRGVPRAGRPRGPAAPAGRGPAPAGGPRDQRPGRVGSLGLALVPAATYTQPLPLLAAALTGNILQSCQNTTIRVARLPNKSKRMYQTSQPKLLFFKFLSS